MKIWLGVMAAAAIAALLLRRDMYLDRIEWIAAVAGSCIPSGQKLMEEQSPLCSR